MLYAGIGYNSQDALWRKIPKFHITAFYAMLHQPNKNCESPLSNALTKLMPLSQGLFWLTGPIFGKELRVSSRRRRNYVLRFAYLMVLTVFVAMVWIVTAGIRGSVSPAFQVSRMPEAGKEITTAIIWYQFIALQLIAVVALSTAISDELYHGTLGVLMTTPISSLQIVAGKLFSRLLGMILLLGISLPLLAIVRVFGGVPWGYVVSGLCVTVTAAAFAGAISLFFSIYNRQAISVIMRTVFVCFLLYGMPWWILMLLRFAYPGLPMFNAALFHINPFAVMVSSTQRMLYSSSGGPAVSAALHCGIMACGTVLLLALSAILVRKAGLRQATGQTALFSSRKERRTADVKDRMQDVSAAVPARIRRVRGPAIIWKEMRIPLIRGHRLKSVIGSVVAIVVLATVYGVLAYEGYLVTEEAQIGFIVAYLGLGLFRTAAVSATSITSEKEAHTWPILLLTPLEGKHIVLGKIVGSCLRSWPFWLLLIGHIVVFTFAGCIHPIGAGGLLLLIAGSALLISSIGVFFSSCFRRNSSSAAVNLLLFFSFVVPVCCCPIPIHLFSPLVIAAIIISGTEGVKGSLFGHLGSSVLYQVGQGLLIGACVLVGIVAVYVLVAFVCFALATSMVRTRIF